MSVSEGSPPHKKRTMRQGDTSLRWWGNAPQTRVCSQNAKRPLIIVFGHSEGTFDKTLFWGPLFKVPSELPHCQCGVREGRFVVFVTQTRSRNANLRLALEFCPSEGTFSTKKLRTNNKGALRIAKLSTWCPWEPFCHFRNVHASPKQHLMIEFGHSKGTFTIEKFWGPIIRVPSELQNSQNCVC